MNELRKELATLAVLLDRVTSLQVLLAIFLIAGILAFIAVATNNGLEAYARGLTLAQYLAGR